MDFLIKNGTVYDPAEHRYRKGDVAWANGKIAAPKADHDYRQVVDADGCIVMTGLIDYHVHYMRGASEGGVNADGVSFCCGITTAVDGGSAGFEKSLQQPAKRKLSIRFIGKNPCFCIRFQNQIFEKPVAGKDVLAVEAYIFPTLMLGKVHDCADCFRDVCFYGIGTGCVDAAHSVHSKSMLHHHLTHHARHVFQTALAIDIHDRNPKGIGVQEASFVVFVLFFLWLIWVCRCAVWEKNQR